MNNENPIEPKKMVVPVVLRGRVGPEGYKVHRVDPKVVRQKMRDRSKRTPSR